MDNRVSVMLDWMEEHRLELKPDLGRPPINTYMGLARENKYLGYAVETYAEYSVGRKHWQAHVATSAYGVMCILIGLMHFMPEHSDGRKLGRDLIKQLF